MLYTNGSFSHVIALPEYSNSVELSPYRENNSPSAREEITPLTISLSLKVYYLS